MSTTVLTTPSPQAADLIGTYRTFGTEGPLYEVMSIGPVCRDGRNTVHVRLVLDGQEADYPVDDARADPLAE